MNILIFDWSVQGHHLEYLHHIYCEAVKHTKHHFYFYVPAEFAEVKYKFIWEKAENIDIQYLKDKDLMKCKKKNLLVSAFFKSLIIRRIVLLHHIDRVWLIMFMHLMPFLPFMLPGNVLISGILYRIYFYEGSNIKGARLLLEKLRYAFLAKEANVEAVYVLNDELAASKLNSIYSSSKFIQIPDPVPMIDDSRVRNIRQEIGVGESETMFLHFGGLDERKGTLEILKAIIDMPSDKLKGKVFVFAGKIKDSIHDDFYSLLQKAERKTRIIVYDEFCSYLFLINLCNSTDYILIPYKNTNQSSGVIGYASFFSKPVIGPSQGLLGRLIKSYNLGYAIDDLSSTGLARTMSTVKPILCSREYAITHSVEKFSEVLWRNLQ
ncbi:MAG: glycosyltransferase [Bacteroidales bacterium]|nr:glycosyltransferase [Candidatus Cryptobacteroides choladohippi]